jgi:hypothetical protein
MTEPAPEIGGVRFDSVKHEDLRFDPSNPRFTSAAGNLGQEKIQELLEREPYLALELVNSFLENGFIAYEPLVVRREGDVYVVVEGNRRLAAVRHILKHRDRYGERSSKIATLEKIPVLIFPDSQDPDRREQRVYLGVRHLFGFRDWPAESKARFLDSSIRNKDDVQRTMRELNIKKTEIGRYLIPFRIRKSAGSLLERYKDEDFWVLGEGLNRAGIREYLELVVDNDSLAVSGFSKPKLRSLLEFIYGFPGDAKRHRKIRETRELSTLAKVLQSKPAAAQLEKGRSLEEAVLFIETREESLGRLKRLLAATRLLLAKLRGQNPKVLQTVRERFADFEEAAKKFLKNA